MNPIYTFGCELIYRLYNTDDGAPVDFSDFSMSLHDELEAQDRDGVWRRYGALLVDANGLLTLPIRGTKGTPEWESDFESLLTTWPFMEGAGAMSHAGFTGIFQTFRLKSGRPLLDVIRSFQAAGKVIIYGHSLGGPLATMLAALAGGCFLICYASPKPGDPVFGAWVRSRTIGRVLFANPKDVVPHVPLTITNLPPPFINEDYEHVDLLTVCDPNSVTPAVPPSWADSHAIVNYQRIISVMDGAA